MAKAFVPNRQFDEDIAKTTEYQQGMRTITSTAAGHVKDAAPVKSGTYRSKIRTFSDGARTGIAAHDIASHLIEFGSVKNPAYAPMRRGVRAAGLRLEQSPKQ